MQTRATKGSIQKTFNPVGFIAGYWQISEGANSMGQSKYNLIN